MALTYIRAPESTENIPSSRRVRDVADRISALDPNTAPFMLVTQKAKSKSTSNTKYEWFEKGLPARWDQVNGAINSSATALVVDNAAYWSVNDIGNNPRTGEKFRVTAVVTGTQTLTIVRGVGSTAGAAMNDNDDLQIMGDAYAEGSLSGAEKSHIESNPYGLTQIFRTPLGVTRSQAKSENYTGDDRTRLRKEKGIEHKMQIEMTGLFGERSNDTSSTDNPRRMTGGFMFYCGTAAVVKDVSGVLTEPTIETWLQDVFQHTGASDTRVLYASSLIITAIDQLAAGRIVTATGDSTYGLAIRQWVTGHGTLNIVKHKLLENGPGGTGYGGWAFAMDPSKTSWRFLNDSNTQLHTDIQANDLDGFKDEYLTEGGWQIENPEVHGILKNVTG